MRAKLLSSVTALGLAACTVLATGAPASAAPWGRHGGGWHRGGFGWPAAGVVGGAVAAATSPLWAPGYYDYAPGYAYAPDYIMHPALMSPQDLSSRRTATRRIARHASAPTIRRRERIWAMTACGILARNSGEQPPATLAEA